MKTTRVFKSGNSQAVRLPKEFTVKGKIVEILRRGDEIVLREPGKGLGRAFEVLTELPDDFFAEGRQDTLHGRYQQRTRISTHRRVKGAELDFIMCIGD